jgi:HEAT repeat protein
LSRTDDIVGRLKAAKSLGLRKTSKSIDGLKLSLNADSFYGVRIAASESLRKIGTDEAFAVIVDSLQQNDARVRKQVTADLSEFYRAETRQRLGEILERERNPEIQAVALRALAKFQDKKSQAFLKKYLNTPSFRNVLADAAVSAIAQQRSSQLSKALLSAVVEHDEDFTSRGLAAALTALGRVHQTAKNRQAVRQTLAGFLDDPRSPVRMGAIRGLGQLRDLRSAPLLESLVRTERDDRVATAAQSALSELQQSAASAPREVVELRKEVTELKKTTDELMKELKTMRAQIDANRSVDRPQAATEKQDLSEDGNTDAK